MDWINTILWGIAEIIFGIIFLYASTQFAEYLRHLKEKVGTEKYNAIMQVVRDVVRAMEQVYGAGHGKEKKEQAMKFLTEHLHLPPEEADKLIEGAVFELNLLLKKMGVKEDKEE